MIRVHVCAAGLALLIAAAPQQVTFRSSVDAVRVDVLVTKDGQPVSGLHASDFAITDNGVGQTIDAVAIDDSPLRVVLALDTSGSVTGDRLRRLQQAGGALLDALRAGDEAGLIEFSHTVVLSAAPTPQLDIVRRALATTTGEGKTSLIDAAYAGLALADANPSRSLMILLSDGIDTASWLAPETVLKACQRGNVVVYPVTTASVPPAFLDGLSLATGGRVLQIRSVQESQEAFLRILAEFRQRYLVGYTPKAPMQSGWHDIRVKVSSPGATVRARPGYIR